MQVKHLWFILLIAATLSAEEYQNPDSWALPVKEPPSTQNQSPFYTREPTQSTSPFYTREPTQSTSSFPTHQTIVTQPVYIPYVVQQTTNPISEVYDYINPYYSYAAMHNAVPYSNQNLNKYENPIPYSSSAPSHGYIAPYTSVTGTGYTEYPTYTPDYYSTGYAPGYSSYYGGYGGGLGYNRGWHHPGYAGNHWNRANNLNVVNRNNVAGRGTAARAGARAGAAAARPGGVRPGAAAAARPGGVRPGGGAGRVGGGGRGGGRGGRR